MSDEKDSEKKRPANEDDAAEAGEASETEQATAEEGEGGETEAEVAAEGEAAEGDVEIKENRAARRKKKKKGADGEVSRDRNKRVRDQLMKKQREAERVADPLTAGEMVDDAFARGVSASGKWLKGNMSLVQGLVVALVLGGAGYAVWHWRSTVSSEQSSASLMAGVTADRGRVDPDAKKPEGDEPPEDAPTFKTREARIDAALGAYRKVASSSKGSGAAILARLGEAGMLLDKKSWEEALTAYREVKASPLANADPDVKGRAIEGIAFALEGKGDRDAALSALKELETVSGEKGFRELALYHQARLLALKGDKVKALEMLGAAHKRLAESSDAKHLAYLNGVIEELWRSIDAPSAPKKAPSLGGGQMSLEEQMRMVQELQEKMRKSQQDAPPVPSK